MRINREKIQRMIGAQGSGSGGGGGMSSAALESMLAMYATRQWVQSNFLTIEFFQRLFTVHGENDTTVDPNDTESTITAVESMFGFWTNFYISALGTGGASTLGLRLSQLDDVNVAGVTNGQVLTWDNSLSKWVPSTPSSGVDMTTVWGALAGATSEQINATHLSAVLSSYAAQSWVTNNFLGLHATADSAQRLAGNTTYSAWGQTYWSAGTPNDISGNMSSVGNITMQSGDHSILTTSGNLILGYSNNEWVQVMDICSYSGSSYWNIHQNGDSEFANVYSRGYVTALSDIRFKEVVNRFQLDVETIAKASLIQYKRKDLQDGILRVGGIAQEWQKILPEAVQESKEGRLSMDYGVIAFTSAVSLARKIQDQQKEIGDLREKNAQLERRLQRLESMFAVDVD